MSSEKLLPFQRVVKGNQIDINKYPHSWLFIRVNRKITPNHAGVPFCPFIFILNMQSSHSSSQQSTNIQNVIRKRPPVSSLRIDTPVHNPSMLIAVGDSSASTSSATSDSDYSPFQLSRPTRSLKNMKKLSLSLPSPQPSDSSIQFPPSDTPCPTSNASKPPQTDRSRRLSVVSLPGTSVKTLLHRKEEEGSPTIPYLDGPTQIVPGIWLGSEDNARDWKGLVERGIRSILNVAKEVVSPFDSAKPLRPFASTPNLNDTLTNFTPTSYPAHLPSGRPSMHYLKLPWSHGQQNLVQEGFPAAMEFTDAALDRGDGVLIQYVFFPPLHITYLNLFVT
jgi:tyrosine-protein phosphatase MSG5